MYHELKSKDFARLFGTAVNDIPDDCQKLIAQHNFRYRKLDGGERDQDLLDVLGRVDSNQFSVTGKKDDAARKAL